MKSLFCQAARRQQSSTNQAEEFFINRSVQCGAFPGSCLKALTVTQPHCAALGYPASCATASSPIAAYKPPTFPCIKPVAEKLQEYDHEIYDVKSNGSSSLGCSSYITHVFAVCQLANSGHFCTWNQGNAMRNYLSLRKKPLRNDIASRENKRDCTLICL